jgi:hypothetical protein
MGAHVDAVASRDALANPDALAWFEEYARELASAPPGPAG